MRYIFPIIAFFVGFLFFLGVGRQLSIWIFRGIIFSTVIFAIFIIRFKSFCYNRSITIKLIRHYTFVAIIVLPFIILDTIIPIPISLNELSLVPVVIGISLTSLKSIKILFGNPTFMLKGGISQYFIELFSISNREYGCNKARIGRSFK